MKKILGIGFCTVLAVSALFAISGTLFWWNAWLFLAFVVTIGMLTTRLINKVPGLAEERRSAAETAGSWDLNAVLLINLALPAMALVSALEIRLEWFPSIPIVVSVCAFIVMIPASALTYRAIAANPFFSSHVHIQKDRGHTVVSSGPYRILRHPGYAGSIAFNLMVPLAPFLGCTRIGNWHCCAPVIPNRQGRRYTASGACWVCRILRTSSLSAYSSSVVDDGKH